MCYPPDEYTRQNRIYDSTTHPCDADTKKRIQKLIEVDPLHEFSGEELELLREHRVRQHVLTPGNWFSHNTCWEL
jgi:hypothetical protein